MLDLFDFVSERGENTIHRWAGREKLSTRDRAILNQKLDRLVQIDFELAVGIRLLAGPLRGHIYKLRVFGDVMMRPLLCKGPLLLDREYTLLLGAIERGGVLDPRNYGVAAVKHREIVQGDPGRRCKHERL